jgi:serine/threonine-protein kinase
MGRVYRAEQATLGRTVAVKVIHPHLLHDDQTVARFYTEARAASRLNHPNSVSIIDFGRSDDGLLYLVMEFLRGADLALVMQRDGPLPFKRICDLMLPVLEALGEAHALDIVHRDLKPENIILRRFRSGGDQVKVVDFGLATIVGNQSTQITRPGLVCGTPDYMAPEQARGDGVDGRGDLYSLGVVLFELLTERLPFVDETPTKVVLRHIHDPIPDPRIVAPHRNIPDELAAVALTALQKRPEARFPTAAAMAAAIREASRGLGAPAAGVACNRCGVRNPRGMRFCGGCGARLPDAGESPSSSRSRRPAFVPPLGTERALVGRAGAMERLDRARAEAGSGVVWLRIEGEQGVGRSRLLAEAATRFAAQGDLVVGAGPHPSGALVPYGSMRPVIAALLEVEEAALASVATRDSIFTESLARAGIAELVEPRGLPAAAGASDRSGAVAVALAAAIREACRRERPSRLVLAFDDVRRCDELSQRALSSLPAQLGYEPVLVLTVGAPVGLDPSASRLVHVDGLTLEEAEAFFRGEPSDRVVESEPPGRGARRLLPLYLEQLLALGETNPSDDSLPLRLADAVAQRVDRLSVQGRRALQAAAVLGQRAALDELREILADGDLTAALGELSEKGFATLDGESVDIVHPFVTELVEAFIPAEARKQLHLRALQVRSHAGAPPEVRAEHAYRAGDAWMGLMILEVAGDRSLRLGATGTAVHFFRRSLELARREVIHGGESSLEAALATFSRKLGDALLADGDPGGADGVLREALDLTGPASPDRARMLISLGRVAAHRSRPRDAMRLFGQALELIAGVDADVEAEVQLEVGRIRRASGDPRNAGNAFRRALELLEQMGATELRVARAFVELGEAELDSGAVDRAEAAFERGLDLARRVDAPSAVAAATGALGLVERARGDEPRARARFEDAAASAAEAGDARARARFWRLRTPGAGLKSPSEVLG